MSQSNFNQMKTIGFFLLLSFLVLSGMQAQSFGARAGANLAKITGEEDGENGTIFAWQLGPFLDFKISDAVELNVAALYARKGTKDELGDQTANTDYLEFPALIRYYIDPIFIQAGAYAAYLLSADVDGQDVGDLLKDGDFGAILGAGVRLGNIRLDVRYSLGITNINEFDEDDLKNAVLTFGAEISF